MVVEGKAEGQPEVVQTCQHKEMEQDEDRPEDDVDLPHPDSVHQL